MERSGPTAKRKPESRPPVSSQGHGVWNASKPVREGHHGRSLIQPPDLNAKKGFYGGKGRTYSQTESIIQPPDFGARRGVWEHEKAYSGRAGGKERT